MATVQRNALVAPFSFNSPLLDGSQTNAADKSQAKRAGGKSSGAIAPTHQRWITQIQQAVNGTAQVTATIPANSGSDGEPGTFAFDSNWLYVAVGRNTWRRAALNVF